MVRQKLTSASNNDRDLWYPNATRCTDSEQAASSPTVRPAPLPLDTSAGLQR
jgi:hypothetical protein